MSIHYGRIYLSTNMTSENYSPDSEMQNTYGFLQLLHVELRKTLLCDAKFKERIENRVTRSVCDYSPLIIFASACMKALDTSVLHRREGLLLIPLGIFCPRASLKFFTV